MLAMLEQKTLPADSAAALPADNGHPAAAMNQEALNAAPVISVNAAQAAGDKEAGAKALGGGLLGGLFFWAKPAKTESETIGREKLVKLDEKLRNRRYKSWDDVMHG
jgi:hypothetical protein